MGPPRVHVITFATKEYANSAEVLRHSALISGNADSFRVYTPHDGCVRFFYESSGASPTDRGAGYWGWKPTIIRHALETIAVDGDIVLYVDAGALILDDLPHVLDLEDPEYRTWDVRLYRLGEAIAKNYKILFWTKAEALERMSVTVPETSNYLVNAAIQAYRKTPAALSFVAEYEKWCGDLRIVSDDPTFPNHRHDQSVLSVLASRNSGLVDLRRDPTQHGKNDPILHAYDVGIQPWIDHHRRRIRKIPRVSVITATTGSPHLAEAVQSVAFQTLPGTRHWIVVDGPEHASKVHSVLAPWISKFDIRVVTLPRKVGANGWNGHRIYGALPWLVDEESTHVAFLDEDNWWDADHLENIMEAVRSEKAVWGYSLRRIVDRDGKYACDDLCESLGSLHHTVCGVQDRLVDTSCYVIERDLAIAMSPVWNAKARDERPNRPEVDRALCSTLIASGAPSACSRRATVAYRLGSTALSVQRSFFERGNALFRLDFSKPDVYVFHFGAEQTARYFSNARFSPHHTMALEEWQMTLLLGLEKHFNLVNGFTNIDAIPRGATVLVTMCIPDQLPLEFLEKRKDLRRIVYTAESPNIRHSKQWEKTFLQKHFDVALTYWDGLLDGEFPTVFAPHNTHHLDFDVHGEVLRPNRDATKRGIAVVLERRDHLGGEFDIDGQKLRCLDPLRPVIVSGLRNPTLVGRGWTGPHVASNSGKSGDSRHAVDWYQDHAFALIIENVDANGYVSEKLYDALIAGSIPLYWGNVSDRIFEHNPVLRTLFVDIRNKTGKEVQAIIDSMTDADIDDFRRRIYANRREALRRVGCAEFAACFRRALAVVD